MTRSKGTSSERLPDFLIVGAMKSGTASLRHVLSQHRQVLMPRREIFFFDIDDIEQHPDFFVETPTGWSLHDYERNSKEYLAWYRSFFTDARPEQMVGEGSTTYMASRKAPPRIAALLPDVKLVFLLRDPVSRAYSHYWHCVRTGRAIYDFEATLRHAPGTIIQRGLYKSHIVRYKRYFPDRNMKFVVFEALIRDIRGTVNEICGFLGVDRAIEVREGDAHRNPTRYPRSPQLQLLFNRSLRRRVDDRYATQLPNMPPPKQHAVARAIETCFGWINPLRTGTGPPMKPETRRFLERLFATENRGLADLIGMELQRYWPYMRE